MMVWSKIAVYFLNAAGTSAVFSALIYFSLDIKAFVVIYCGAILILMYIAEKIAELDKGTSLNKEKCKSKKLLLQIDLYDEQIASIHSVASRCLAGKVDNSTLKYQIHTIIQQLHEIKRTTERNINNYEERQGTSNIKTDTWVDFN